MSEPIFESYYVYPGMGALEGASTNVAIYENKMKLTYGLAEKTIVLPVDVIAKVKEFIAVMHEEDQALLAEKFSAKKEGNDV